MKIIDQDVILLSKTTYKEMCNIIEEAGRTCYKSEFTDFDLKRAEEFIRKILKAGHESVIEHQSLTFKITTNRAIANEIVRHRIASYSQESTRYCNYSKDKFDNELTFIKPIWYDGAEPKIQNDWEDAMKVSEISYKKLLDKGLTPDKCRGVLPLDLKTEITVTMNLRALRNFLKLRTAKNAHPQIQEVANKILHILKDKYPVFTEYLDTETTY